MFNRLGLIGCGLMGGSLSLALQRAQLVKQVVGYSTSQHTLEVAYRNGVIHAAAPSAAETAASADLIVIAVPVAATGKVLQKGALGDIVAVENVSTRAKVYGVVLNSDLVKIEIGGLK